MTHRGAYAGCDVVADDEHDACVSDQTAAATLAWGFWYQAAALAALHFVIFAFMRVDIFQETERTPRARLLDAAATLFPPLAAGAARSTLPGAAFVDGRPDIRSFGFDLGGSTCACTLQWDRRQYWQRLLYGEKYVCGHVFTAFLGVLVSHRWQWVLLYKFMNEIVEELDMPVNGVWGRGDPIMDMEPRYDSLVNDTLLAAVPFTVLCCHLLYVIDMPDPLAGGLNYDLPSCKALALLFAQYYVLNEANGVWTRFGAHDFGVPGTRVDTGKAFAALVQLVVLRIIWAMRALPRPMYWQSAVCLGLIWCPFVFRSGEQGAHEQIAALLAFSAAGFVIAGYHLAFTRKHRAVLVVMLALYAAAFTVYGLLTFGSVAWVAAPADSFYYRRKWCGLAGEGVQDSCRDLR